MSATPLNSGQQTSFNKAKEATTKRNHDYAITLLTPLVKEAYTHIESRRLLRANLKAKLGNMSFLQKKMALASILPLVAKGRMALKNPSDAMAIAEDILAKDPASTQGHELLADAALAAELSDLEIFALESIRESDPKNAENLRRLGETYLRLGEAQKAQEAFQAALAINPNDGEANKGLKDASAAFASAAGGWEEKGDFRQSLKSSDEAKQLEQAARAVSSEESIMDQINTVYAEFDENNPNVNVTKKIATLYEKAKDIDNALQWYEYSFELTNRADPSIEKSISRLNNLQLDQRLKDKKAELEATTDEEQRAALQTELDQLEGQRAEQSLQEAKERVARYPNDLQLRFELGQALVKTGDFKSAVPELQQALRQPAVRHKAFHLLGSCYWNRNMLDLAKKQFDTAIGEIPVMDSLKKDLIYDRGTLLETMDDKEAALEDFKSIYEVDSQYRDVEARIEAAYG